MFDTYIGDEICVTVLFDHQPSEPETLTYSGCEAEVTLTSVLVNGYEHYNILDVLSPACIDSLEQQAFEELQK